MTLTDGDHASWSPASSTAPARSTRSPPTRCSASLARTGLVRPGPAGLGVDTADDGRVLGVLPETRCRSTPSAPCDAATCGRPRRCPRSASRPTTWRAPSYARCTARRGAARPTPTGSTLTTSKQGGRDLQRRARSAAAAPGRRRGRACAAAVELDPGFAQAQAALALLGHEWGATGSWRSALRAAHAAAAERHLDDREVSFLDAVTTRLRSDEATGAAALLRHVRLFPRDALAVSVAVPTVAFGGLTSGPPDRRPGRGSGPQLRRRLVVRRPAGLRPPGPGALGRGGGPLVVRPLGRARLRPRRARPRPRVLRDRRSTPRDWPGSTSGSAPQGPQANHRSHFSWHAALHELMQGDVDAVRRRYERELAPPLVTGSRALVDSGALLWRCHVTDALETATLPSEAVCGSAPDGWLISPPDPVRRPARGAEPGGRAATRSGWPRCAPPRSPTPTRSSATWSRRSAARCRPSVERDYDVAAPHARGRAPPRRRPRRQRGPARGARGHPRLALARSRARATAPPPCSTERLGRATLPLDARQPGRHTKWSP